MRMRKSSFNSFSPSSCASPSCSSSSPPSSISSSSSITTNSLSLASSTDSSSSFSPYSSNLVTRCQGLDLLVKAIHLVTAGSVVGVPYIQRRVVRRRRRRRALEFNALILNQFLVFEKDEAQLELKRRVSTKARSISKRQKRGMPLPSQHQDSVLQTLKPKSR